MRNRAGTVIAVLSLLCGFGTHVAAAPAGRAACGNSLETWFAPQGNGYAGSAGYVVEFSNLGTATCTVTGYPTVTLTKNGKQVGLTSRDDALFQPGSPPVRGNDLAMRAGVVLQLLARDLRGAFAVDRSFEWLS